MWAIVGLGNPGRRYLRTRHNVGFLFIKKIAKEWNVRLRKKMFLSKTAEVSRKRNKILLVLPLTYMNNSGLAVKQVIEGKDIKLENLVVVYDDLDIPLGEIRIRKRGGPGTHKGMNSIIQEIKTTEFPRIRVGSGPLLPGKDAIDHVLSSFDKSEKPLVEKGLKKAQSALDMILIGHIDRAMNMYNHRGKTLSN